MRKKVKRLGWVLGCTNYCQETRKQIKNKDQPTNNYKKKKGNITFSMDDYLRNG